MNKKALCKHFHIIRVDVVKTVVQTGSQNRENSFFYLNNIYVYITESLQKNMVSLLDGMDFLVPSLTFFLKIYLIMYMYF